jgi:hypothetical protein
MDSIAENISKKKFFMVSPFIPQLQRWIRRFKTARKQGKLKSANLKVVEGTESEGVSDYSITHIEPKKYTTVKAHEADQTDPIALENSLKALLGIRSFDLASTPKASFYNREISPPPPTPLDLHVNPNSFDTHNINTKISEQPIHDLGSYRKKGKSDSTTKSSNVSRVKTNEKSVEKNRVVRGILSRKEVDQLPEKERETLLMQFSSPDASIKVFN